MRNKIFGVIGIVWGGAVFLNWIFSSSGTKEGSDALKQGQAGAAIFGIAMLAAGLYVFLKKKKKD